MPYSYSTFLRPLSPTDVNIIILDTSGVVQYTISSFSIVSVKTYNNLLRISVRGLNDILLEFSNPTEARMSLQLLQSHLDILKQKDPLFVDKQIENYVGFQGASGSQGSGFQGFQGSGSSISRPNNEIIVGDTASGIKSFSNNTFDGKTQIITTTFSNYSHYQRFFGTGFNNMTFDSSAYHIG